jgi:hypothetical protein
MSKLPPLPPDVPCSCEYKFWQAYLNMWPLAQLKDHLLYQHWTRPICLKDITNIVSYTESCPNLFSSRTIEKKGALTRSAHMPICQHTITRNQTMKHSPTENCNFQRYLQTPQLSPSKCNEMCLVRAQTNLSMACCVETNSVPTIRRRKARRTDPPPTENGLDTAFHNA